MTRKILKIVYVICIQYDYKLINNVKIIFKKKSKLTPQGAGAVTSQNKNAVAKCRAGGECTRTSSSIVYPASNVTAPLPLRARLLSLSRRSVSLVRNTPVSLSSSGVRLFWTCSFFRSRLCSLYGPTLFTVNCLFNCSYFIVPLVR